jgi:hypothetical protein
MKVLEEDVEKSLQREESRLDAEEQSFPDDVQKVVQDLKSKHNVSANYVGPIVSLRWGVWQLEVEQLRKRTSEVEIKHARVVHDVSHFTASVIMKLIHRRFAAAQRDERAGSARGIQGMFSIIPVQYSS